MKYLWQEFKTICNTKRIPIQFQESDGAYNLEVYDGPKLIRSSILKTDPKNEDQTDFETNFKELGNQKLMQSDTDNAQIVRIKAAKAGWSFCAIPLEFSTSQVSGTYYSKTSDGTDRAGFTVKSYDSSDIEVTTPGDLDINLSTIVKTIIDFEPSYDYEVIGGQMRTMSPITDDIRLWIIAVPDIPAIYGGSKEMCGGINLKFLTPGNVYEVDGRVSKYLAYNQTYHTNKLRLIFTYPAGVVEKLSVVFEIYKQ